MLPSYQYYYIEYININVAYAYIRIRYTRYIHMYIRVYRVLVLSNSKLVTK